MPWPPVSNCSFTSYLTSLRCAETGRAHDPTGIFKARGAALVPALTRLLELGDIGRDERIALLNTGSVLKYTHLVDWLDRPPINPLPA